MTPLPQATTLLLSETSFVLEGEAEGPPDTRGESQQGLSVSAISEDEEGGGNTGSRRIQGTSPQ